MSDASVISEYGPQVMTQVQQQQRERAFKASNALRNAALNVLRGQRSGRRYTVPHTKVKYTASAPGEPPAVRTGAFRLSWRQAPHNAFNGATWNVNPAIETKQGRLANWLEYGTKRMKPRPFAARIRTKARTAVVKIYKQPYL